MRVRAVRMGVVLACCMLGAVRAPGARVAMTTTNSSGDVSGHVQRGLEGGGRSFGDAPSHGIQKGPIDVIRHSHMVKPKAGGKPYMLAFDAGATAEKLVVVAVCESSAAAGEIDVSYGGVALKAAFELSDSKVGIYYLDKPFTGGKADLIVDFAGVETVNGVGIAVVSLSGAARGAPAAVASDRGAPGALDVDIDVRQAGSFVIAGFNANEKGEAAAIAPPTELFAQDIGSAVGAVGYGHVAAAQDYTCRFSCDQGAVPRYIVAAAFAPAQSPTDPSLLLIPPLAGKWQRPR